MPKVHSPDGTAIAFETAGAGPPVVLVDGAFGSRTFGPNPALARLLAERFTVCSYDRRGRGDSGDTPPYSITREIDDLEALIGAVGGTACVYGISSGGALALEAAARFDVITKLAIFEAPFIVDDSRAPIPDGYLAELRDHVAAGRRGQAVKLFMRTGVGLSPLIVGLMRVMPAWSKLTAAAHTAPYDAAIVAEYQRGRPLPRDRWAAVTARTLVVDGGKSPVAMRNAMRQLSEVLPDARHRRLERQTHLVKAKVLAPVLADFFTAEAATRTPSKGGSAVP